MVPGTVLRQRGPVRLVERDYGSRDRVTLSVGATHFLASRDGFSEAYAAADQALYHVKAHGRDGWRRASRISSPA